MSNLPTELQQEHTEIEESTEHNPSTQEKIPYFGYSLLRDILIPELLGADTNEISYWAGKQLARKFPLNSIDEIILFFAKAAWGVLTLVKTEKYVLELELTGDMVKKRFADQAHASFHLEAGFVAEQIQRQKNCLTEAYLTSKERAGKILISVQWDKKDILTTESRVDRYKK
ncbi:DUF2507 domain-containing protein [Priestia megaterium]|nr:DUF2507 domain-containing protein [Priestia megaterium]